MFALRRMIFNIDLLGRSELSHDATPVPAQAPWLQEATNNVQQHAAKSSLGKSEFHKVSGECRRRAR